MRSLRPEGLCERDNRLTGAGRTKPTTWMRESRGMFFSVSRRRCAQIKGFDRVGRCIRCELNKNPGLPGDEMAKSGKPVAYYM